MSQQHETTLTSPTQVLKSIGPKLVPFFKTVAIYFVVFIPNDRPSLFALALKCLPIISLIFFVLLHGISLGNEHAYSRRILLGLAFSCVGDAFLIWPHRFLHGMGAFALAQLMYTSAFGFRPLNLGVGFTLYALEIAVLYILVPGLKGPLVFGVPFYSTLLMTMAWRAIARVQFFQELWTWTKLCSCVGGILFAISDGFIGFHHFHNPVPNAQTFIMVTYYAAQLGIALSVVDSKVSYVREQEALKGKKKQQIKQKSSKKVNDKIR